MVTFLYGSGVVAVGVAVAVGVDVGVGVGLGVVFVDVVVVGGVLSGADASTTVAFVGALDATGTFVASRFPIEDSPWAVLGTALNPLP
ncbi:MAG TPA: hypothetical protein VFU73_04705 [Actinocrinis sp.]|nr:hypothetical protein [Actinocrinis sp.]